MTAPLAIVAAVAENSAIGESGSIPWRSRADLRNFADLTIGCPIVMGRATYESIGRPLSSRTSIVLTRRTPLPPANPGHEAPVHWFSRLDDALAFGASICRGTHVMVIGGACVYRQTLARVPTLYLTRIHACPRGDRFFPTLDPDAWECRTARHLAREPGEPRATFLHLERRQS